MGSLRESSILFLGGGRMATGIIRGLLEKGPVPAERIAVIGRDRTRLAALQERFSVRIFTADDPGIPRCDIVVLAVPPQAVPEALAANKEHIPQDALLISVCAGIRIAELESLLTPGPDTSDTPRIIRVMPNTLGPSGHGFSALCPSPAAVQDDIACAEALFGCLGQVHEIEEDMFDAFTAFSCSGPAYVLAFIDAMIRAGRQAGFSGSESRTFVLENLLGTVLLLQQAGEEPAGVLDRMCTPGGITIAAMDTLSNQPFAESISSAVQVGIERAGSFQRND